MVRLHLRRCVWVCYFTTHGWKRNQAATAFNINQSMNSLESTCKYFQFYYHSKESSAIGIVETFVSLNLSIFSFRVYWASCEVQLGLEMTLKFSSWFLSVHIYNYNVQCMLKISMWIKFPEQKKSKSRYSNTQKLLFRSSCMDSVLTAIISFLDSSNALDVLLSPTNNALSIFYLFSLEK